MTNKKLNLKYYLMLNLIFILFVGFRSFGEMSGIIGFATVFIGVSLNQIFLVKGVSLILSSSLCSDSIETKKLRNKGTFYLVLKLIFLIVAFTISVQFIRNAIKMALLFYILTFISLYISLSKDLKHDE
jgi:hypothetical protein